jgi:hypothetical protein
VHVAPIGFEVHDWVADDLSGPVVGDIAAAPGLEHFNAARRERVWRSQDVRAPTIASNAERQNRGMFNEEKLIRDRFGTPFLNELSLKGQRVSICNEAEAANFENSHLVIE